MSEQWTLKDLLMVEGGGDYVLNVHLSQSHEILEPLKFYPTTEQMLLMFKDYLDWEADKFEETFKDEIFISYDGYRSELHINFYTQLPNEKKVSLSAKDTLAMAIA